MRRFGLLSLYLGLCSTILFAGCGKDGWQMSKGSRGGVAVVDLNVVASRLGRADELRDLVKQKQEALMEDWGKLQRACQKELRVKTADFGEKPTEEQESAKEELEKKLTATLTKAQQDAQSELKVYESSLLTRFRDDVKVVARKIAVEKGLSTVVTKSDLFLVSVEPEFEITDAVIEKMRVNLAPMVASAQPSKSERTAEKTIKKIDKKLEQEDGAAESTAAPPKAKSKKQAPQ